MKLSTSLDAGGVIISSLCLIHCIFLPLLGTVLPVMGVISESEAVHKTLLLLALPLWINLVIKPERMRIRILAVLGFSLMLSAAFIEALHDFEIPMTVIGASCLAFAHLRRLSKRRHIH